MPLPPQILLALGLTGCADEAPVEADAMRQLRGSDTCDATGDTAQVDTDAGPCLGVQTCLCTCETGAESGAWIVPALGLLAMARRRERSAILDDLDLPPDVKARLRGTDPER
ncbi:MAG: hypothetical protein H6737_08970 [Alphaproteobacteria bacterium]|nr:hypothetical protein [Alphaproteobacteria bacterium]